MRKEVNDRVEEADDPLPEAAGVVFSAPFAESVAGRLFWIRRVGRVCRIGRIGRIGMPRVACRRAGHCDILRFCRIGLAVDLDGDRVFHDFIGGRRCFGDHLLRRVLNHDLCAVALCAGEGRCHGAMVGGPAPGGLTVTVFCGGDAHVLRRRIRIPAKYDRCRVYHHAVLGTGRGRRRHFRYGGVNGLSIVFFLAGKRRGRAAIAFAPRPNGFAVGVIPFLKKNLFFNASQDFMSIGRINKNCRRLSAKYIVCISKNRFPDGTFPIWKKQLFLHLSVVVNRIAIRIFL